MKQMFSLRSVSYDLRDSNILALPKPTTTTYGLDALEILSCHMWYYSCTRKMLIRKKKNILIFRPVSLPTSMEASLLVAAPEALRPLGLPSDTKSAFSISKCLKRRMKNFPHRGVWWGRIRCNILQVWISRSLSLGTASYWCSIHL